MKNWRFQIFQHYDDGGEPYLAIHEFYMTHEKEEVWTLRPVPLEADSVVELRLALLQVLFDMEKHGVRDIRTGEPVVQTEDGRSNVAH